MDDAIVQGRKLRKPLRVIAGEIGVSKSAVEQRARIVRIAADANRSGSRNLPTRSPADMPVYGVGSAITWGALIEDAARWRRPDPWAP